MRVNIITSHKCLFKSYFPSFAWKVARLFWLFEQFLSLTGSLLRKNDKLDINHWTRLSLKNIVTCRCCCCQLMCQKHFTFSFGPSACRCWHTYNLLEILCNEESQAIAATNKEKSDFLQAAAFVWDALVRTQKWIGVCSTIKLPFLSDHCR